MRRPLQRGNQCLGVALLGTQRPERKFMPLLSALARALDASVFDVDWKARVDFEDPYYTSMPERPEVQRPAVWFPD